MPAPRVSVVSFSDSDSDSDSAVVLESSFCYYCCYSYVSNIPPPMHGPLCVSISNPAVLESTTCSPLVQFCKRLVLIRSIYFLRPGPHSALVRYTHLLHLCFLFVWSQQTCAWSYLKTLTTSHGDNNAGDAHEMPRRTGRRVTKARYDSTAWSCIF